MPKDTSEFPSDGVVVIGPVDAADALDPSPISTGPATTESCETPTETPVRAAPRLRRHLPSPLAVIVFMLKVAFVGFATMLLLLLVFFTRGFPNKNILLNYQPNLTTDIYGQGGEILDEFATDRRIYTPIEDIPAVVQQAFISAEDKNFFTHPGFDTRAIAIAGLEAIRTLGARIRGASTITQQMLKNVVLRDQPRLERKLNELLLATRTEVLIGKDKVLEIYLNEIFLGQKSYGVTAAAQTYFNKPLAALSVREAAILAAFAKSPSTLHPVRNHDRLLARRDYILEEMYENGDISNDIYEFEVVQPIETVQDRSRPAYAASLPPRSYFSDGIRRQLSGTLGADTVFTGGLRATATLDAPFRLRQKMPCGAVWNAMTEDKGFGVRPVTR